MHLLGINSLDRLITELSRLPGIGRKSAQRLAIFILKGDEELCKQPFEGYTGFKKRNAALPEVF